MDFNLKQYLKDLETIVNIDSGSHSPEGIASVAAFLRKGYEKAGMSVRNPDLGSNANPCLEARYVPPGSDPDKIDILMIGHMDTVFPEGTAEERPFTIRGGMAYGPGVADMKSGDLLMLYLITALIQSGTNLSICAAHNGDEELGSPNSASWLTELGKKASYCFVFEPGRASGAFVNKRKGVAEFTLDFKGIASHAGGAPEKGASAIVEMANWICKLAGLNDYAAGTSVNTGTVNGGTASNVVPEQASCAVDLRFEQTEELGKIRKTLMDMKDHPFIEGVRAEISEESGTFPPMNITEETKELMKQTEQAGRELSIPVIWESSGGSSDANNISHLGIPVLDGCGPHGSEFHSDREYLVLSSVEERIKLLYHLLRQLEEDIHR